MPAPASSRSFMPLLWVMLGCALIAPLTGLLLLFFTVEHASPAPDPARALDELPPLYLWALVFLGLPSALCGLPLGLALFRLARHGLAIAPLRAGTGAIIGGLAAAAAGRLAPDIAATDLPYPIWAVPVAAGAACGLAFPQAWLSRHSRPAT